MQKNNLEKYTVAAWIFQKQMLRQNLECKVFIRDRHLWKQGGQRYSSKGEVELNAGLTEPQPTWQWALEQIVPVRLLMHQAEMAGPLFPHLVQSAPVGQSTWERHDLEWGSALHLRLTLKWWTAWGCLLSVLPATEQQVRLEGAWWGQRVGHLSVYNMHIIF